MVEEEEKSASPEEEEEVWEVGPIDGAGGEGGLPREIEIGLSQSFFWDRVESLCPVPYYPIFRVNPKFRVLPDIPGITRKRKTIPSSGALLWESQK